MYSMIVNKYGTPDILEYIQTTSKQTNKTSVRLKVHAAGVNFADVLTIKGRYQERPRPPFSPGLEVSGEIIEVGKDVLRLSINKKTYWNRS